MAVARSGSNNMPVITRLYPLMFPTGYNPNLGTVFAVPGVSTVVFVVLRPIRTWCRFFLTDLLYIHEFDANWLRVGKEGMKSSRHKKCKARTVVGRVEKSLLCDPGSESWLSWEGEKRRANTINRMNTQEKQKRKTENKITKQKIPSPQARGCTTRP